MDFGIIGLPLSGKSTVLAALTGAHAPADAFDASKPHIGVVKVPDERLARLSERFQPKKTTPAEARFLDFPGAVFARGFGREGGRGEAVTTLGRADALVHVVRAFGAETVPHPEGTVDADRDVSTMDMELAFADLGLIDKRLERIDAAVRSARPGERDQGEREVALLRRLKDGLEAEKPIRAQQLSPEESRALGGYDFLTVLPQLLLLNVGESDVARADELTAEFESRHGGSGRRAAWLCAELEMELAQLPPAEASEMRASYGLTGHGPDAVLTACIQLLDVVLFYTVGDPEARAWPVPRGTPAQRAAGKIHTDLERGFVRAEVLGWDALLEQGSLAEARKHGILRVEGKEYVVQDGDVIHVLFSV